MYGSNGSGGRVMRQSVENHRSCPLRGAEEALTGGAVVNNSAMSYPQCVQLCAQVSVLWNLARQHPREEFPEVAGFPVAAAAAHFE